MSSLTLRPLAQADAAPISAAFTAQGWRKPASQYQHYFNEQQAGLRDVIVAELDGMFAGYVTIVWESHYAPFREAGIPEIVDFNVVKRFQRRGVGTALMDEAEARIARRSGAAGIGVGLVSDYGAAQVLYARRGYIPDGRGAVWQGRHVRYEDTVTVDDDLVLYLWKAVGGEEG